MAEKTPSSNKDEESKLASSNDKDSKPSEDSKNSSGGKSSEKSSVDNGAEGKAAGRDGSPAMSDSGSGDVGHNGGARPRSAHALPEKTNSRLHGVAVSYRRSLSPHQRTSANNVKSNRLGRQNRSPNSPQLGRAHTGNANNVAGYVSANSQNASQNSSQTRNHQHALQQQQQQRQEQEEDGNDQEPAAAIAVVNPMPEQLADLAVLEPPHNQEDVPYNWQASKKTLKERMKFMFNNELMADIIFIVGKAPSQRRIPAHKFILATGSAVFDAMFNGAMASTSHEEEIPDVEPAAFLALLRFLYSDEVIIGPETVMTTLYTAKKYAVPALETACVEFLKQNLSSDNAFLLLTQARLFDEPQLAALCLETIDKNTTEALAAEGFSDIDLDTLCAVLERDTLGIREFKLFAAVGRWADAECLRQGLPAVNPHRREALGRALELIRFPLMSVEEFAQGAAQSGILCDREVVELFLYFTVNPKPQVMFKDTPRCCLTGKEQVVSRFVQIENRWGYSGTSDRIRFTVNRRIFVVGFGLYGSIHGPAEYNVNIQIIQTDSGKICGQNDSSFQCDGSMTTFRVMFKEPVEISPNTNFTACATLKGPDSYYGTKGLRKVTHESLSSGKVTFQFTYAAGNNNGTSVEDGQLPEIIFYT